MKINAHVSCVLFVFAFAACCLADAAFDLKEPQLAFPQGFPESLRPNILASLRRSDCKFVGGSFINSFTSLKYGGGTRPPELRFCRGVRWPGGTLPGRGS